MYADFFYYAWFSSKIVSFLFRLLCLLYNNFSFATAAASVFILKPFDIAKIVMFSLTIFYMLLFIPIMWWQSTRSNHFTVYIFIFVFVCKTILVIPRSKFELKFNLKNNEFHICLVSKESFPKKGSNIFFFGFGKFIA